jgi:arginine exporter protein ArgO
MDQNVAVQYSAEEKYQFIFTTIVASLDVFGRLSLVTTYKHQ